MHLIGTVVMAYYDTNERCRRMLGLLPIAALADMFVAHARSAADGLTLRQVAKRDRVAGLDCWWLGIQRAMEQGRITGAGYRDVRDPSDYAVQETVYIKATKSMRVVMKTIKGKRMTYERLVRRSRLDEKDAAATITLLRTNGALWTGGINKTFYSEADI